MGYYITYEAVAGFVGATYDDEKGEYTVYGLTMSENIFEAQVDYADDVVKSYIGEQAKGSSKYTLGRLAALNLAALRIVVIATGGFVSGDVGALTYRLGDVMATREAGVRMAIENSLKSYEASFKEYLYRATAGATSVVAEKMVEDLGLGEK